jgi:hypothetical protein
VHGVVSWFDVAFVGARETVTLSTSPQSPLTHWYQVRLLLGSWERVGGLVVVALLPLPFKCSLLTDAAP